MLIRTADKHNPLYQLLDQINDAAKGGFHLISIGMAVALPAICASLEMADGRASGNEYKRWCRENLASSDFTHITAEQLYSMRCGVLHSGRFDDLKNGIERVVFFPPSRVTIIGGKVNGADVYSAVEFCENICKAVKIWYSANEHKPNVSTDIGRMMTYYPEGLFPYSRGFPVIT